MGAHIVDNFTYARKQTGIIQHGLAYADPILTELPGFDDDPKSSNEPKLEAIQMAWYEEFKDASSE